MSNNPALLKRLQAQGAPTVPPVNGQPSPGAPAPSPSRTPAFDALMNQATPSPFMQTVQAAIKKPTTTPVAQAAPKPAASTAPPDPIKDPKVRERIINAAAQKNDRAMGMIQGAGTTVTGYSAPKTIQRPTVSRPGNPAHDHPGLPTAVARPLSNYWPTPSPGDTVLNAIGGNEGKGDTDAQQERTLALSKRHYQNWIRETGYKLQSPKQRMDAYAKTLHPAERVAEAVSNGITSGITKIAKGTYGAYKMLRGQPVDPSVISKLDRMVTHDESVGNALSPHPAIVPIASLVTQAAPALATLPASAPAAATAAAFSAATAAGETSADSQVSLLAQGKSTEEARQQSIAPSVAIGAVDAAMNAVPGGKMIKGILRPAKAIAETAATNALQTKVTGYSAPKTIQRPTVAK